MRQMGKFFREKPLKVLVYTIIAGYSGQAFTADSGQNTTKEETLVVSAAASQDQDDELAGGARRRLRDEVKPAD